MNIKTYINLVFATIGTSLGFLLGGWDKFLNFLIILVIIDYISGVMKAYKNHNINSSTCYKGIAKKMGIFSLIVIAAQFDNLGLSQTPILRISTIWFYIGNEVISLFENFTELGVNVPQVLKKGFLIFKSEKNN